MMIVCAVIPFFAASIEQQRDPDLSDEPLVLSDNTRKVRRIAAVSREAAQLDIQTGMVVRHAQTLVPEISVLPLHPPQYRERLDTLLNLLYTFSEQIDIAYKGWGAGNPKLPLNVQFAASPLNAAVAFLDVGTLNLPSLHHLGQQLQDTLAIHHNSARVGIATNRFTAWVAAQSAHDGEVAVVPKGEEAWMLMCHPVSLLPLDAKVLRRLGWLGIHTLGDFARLPSAAIPTQFGKPGQRAYQLAQGIDLTPVPNLAREKMLHRSFVFDGAVADREIIHTTLKKLIAELLVLLEKSGETTRKVRLTLFLDNNGAGEYEAKLRRRTHTAFQLNNTLQSLLHRANVTAPIREIALTLGDIVPRAPEQLELFPSMQLVESRQSVLEDLVARYGARFYTAAVTDQQALLLEHQVELKAVDIA